MLAHRHSPLQANLRQMLSMSRRMAVWLLKCKKETGDFGEDEYI